MNKLKSISGKLSRSSLAPPCGSVLHHRPWIMWVSKLQLLWNIQNLKTVFFLLDMRAFSWLVAGVTPFSFNPVIGHLGTDGRFFKY